MVVFRLPSDPSINYIKRVVALPGDEVELRQAVLYDFLKTDIEKTQQEPPQEDMWRDWSDTLRAIDGWKD